MTEKSSVPPGLRVESWDRAERRARRTELRPWPRTRALLHAESKELEGLPKLLVDLVIAANQSPDPQDGDKPPTAAIEAAGAVMEEASAVAFDLLLHLADDHGAMWADLRDPLSLALLRGPILHNVALGMEWPATTGGKPVEVTSHPVFVLAHRGGSTAHKVALRSRIGALMVDPPDDESRDARLEVLRVDSVGDRNSTARAAVAARAVLGLRKKLVSPLPDIVEDTETGAPALELGGAAEAILRAMAAVMDLKDGNAPEWNTVKKLLEDHLNLWLAQLPQVVQPLNATGRLVSITEVRKNGKAAPGWLVEASLTGSLPGIGKVSGTWLCWISWASVRRLAKDLRVILRKDGDPSRFLPPDEPFLPGGPKNLPCALEGVAEAVSEFARARNDEVKPFSKLKPRVRLARLAERFAHEVVPRGLVGLSLDGRQGGEISATLDGEFVTPVHPRLNVEIRLPYDGGHLTLRAAGSAVANWHDVEEAWNLFVKMLDQIPR